MILGDVYLDSALIFVLVAVLAVTIVVILSYFRKATSRRDTFLITGLSDAGKTTLYLRLRYGRIKPTHTSMQENEGLFALHTENADKANAPIHIVDVPGHEKLRYRFAEFLPIARAIIFVVDSSTITQQVRRSAEYLYDILANRHATVPKPIPILVVCNKSDHLLAASEGKIRTLLETEIDKLRATRAAALDKQDSGGQEEVYLGFDNEAFKFDHVPSDITFVKSCLAGTEDEISGIEDIINWIQESS
ncbi:hypothetical protein SmJEL517_g01694 [Synchytrium microbalum]|uniref:Signal recognition particle receptor subunit beta n=1 Tax=Synchytrium microbalum TaxID=1806994 RepID=A0A507C4G8_9FUNG|nr:uncharacterized protein SmJEL517_g01694 [Synchytrium microbalum]TPX35867.1 hypothetical protein SmJEL517_g01694 [Synchytrium microbalum]